MLFLRSLLFSVYMIFSTMLTGTMVFLLFPFPYAWRYNIINVYARSIVSALTMLCGIDYKVEGQEHIQAPAIIFSKHQSTWETYILQLIFPPISFVFKSELLWLPFFGWGLAAMKPISIQRGTGKKAVQQLVQGGIRRLQEGLSVVIFPEGTRTQATGPGRYRIGGAVLAAESGYPVIPVAHNAGEFWRRKGFIKRPGVITVRVGPPIETKGKKPEAILEEARQWIETQMPQITQGQYTAQ
ncbi:MAG: 1-acyl-sn-glycerol-3-phosphate acyltransferase [Gammaproteobacteria bacterium]|nr:1-acyl-sn-glycerol-3-phosphate acyltransferase [Gammaproteobacteria bacterium]